jgi:hypothetical protein
LTTIDRWAKLEVIQNGRVTVVIRCNGDRDQAHKLTVIISEVVGFWFVESLKPPRPFVLPRRLHFMLSLAKRRGELAKPHSGSSSIE